LALNKNKIDIKINMEEEKEHQIGDSQKFEDEKGGNSNNH
jgi:hypothetical protein